MELPSILVICEFFFVEVYLWKLTVAKVIEKVKYFFWVQRGKSSVIVDRPEDTVEHTVEVYPAWAEHRRVLREAIGGGGAEFLVSRSLHV